MLKNISFYVLALMLIYVLCTCNNLEFFNSQTEMDKIVSTISVKDKNSDKYNKTIQNTKKRMSDMNPIHIMSNPVSTINAQLNSEQLNSEQLNSENSENSENSMLINSNTNNNIQNLQKLIITDHKLGAHIKHHLLENNISGIGNSIKLAAHEMANRVSELSLNPMDHVVPLINQTVKDSLAATNQSLSNTVKSAMPHIQDALDNINIPAARAVGNEAAREVRQKASSVAQAVSDTAHSVSNEASLVRHALDPFTHNDTVAAHIVRPLSHGVQSVGETAEEVGDAASSVASRAANFVTSF